MISILKASYYYKLLKDLKRLKSIEGTGTELISLYIPESMPISDVVAKLRDERGQASNIKSKSTRQNVIAAIDKIIQYLKVFKEVPPNGMAIFCGNIAKQQEVPDIELFELRPPAPIKANIYRCDSKFLLDPIENMISNIDTYIVLLLDGREATVATLNGANVTVHSKINSFAHSKMHKGGQSQARFTRIIEGQIEDYYKRVADTINELFINLKSNGQNVAGLLIGGPGPTKEDFVNSKNLNYQIKIIGIYDTGYVDEIVGMRELLEKAKESLVNQDLVKEREIFQRFLNEIYRKGLVVYGIENVKKAVESGNISKLLISTSLDLEEVKYQCRQCGAVFSVISDYGKRMEKHDCGGALDVIDAEDIIERLIEKAESLGAEIYFISSGSEVDEQFVKGFGGIAAFLRYAI
ncbi:MAG: peptide chain release factor subunit 1 [Candidatus Micrarchaeota archaeon]|nr:MAG: peptide chain release factor subunit 1 [Candidatus Micrarchaeota archaeon]